ncbi:MAG: TIGR02611 family protein [Microbacteriaceae bacterium]
MTERESDLERAVDEDVARGSSRYHPLRQWLDDRRAWVDSHPRFRAVYLVLVAILGATIMVIGLVLVPLPGPGWLIVFLGLAILGTEFHWARRLTGWVKYQLNRFWMWWRSRRSKPRDS